MVSELNLHQSPRQVQQLNLAPQLLQWLRLLQIPTIDLATMVQHELETNPVLEIDEVEASSEPEEVMDEEEDDGVERLERKEKTESTEASDEDMNAKYEALAEIESEWREELYESSNVDRTADEDEKEKHRFIMDSIVSKCSLQEYLLNQLTVCDLTAAEREQAELIVGSLDERGYLTTPLSDLAVTGISQEQREKVLTYIQTLDPAGVGARDLRECLLLQMTDPDSVDFLPAKIVRDHFELLGAKDAGGIALALGVANDEVREAMSYIAGLTPEPGRKFSAGNVQYVTPDVTVRSVEGRYLVELNDEFIPRLRISSTCRSLLKSGQKMPPSDLAYIRRKMRNANFLMQGITQRQETLQRVMREIVRVQQDFFDNEKGELVPLTMGKVARIIGVHETTVSRALANKYVRTPHGLFEMKFFFKSGYACSDGSALTPEKVKQMIVDMIEHETPSNPLTDLQMVRLFQERGLTVARRTIAKYREELQIDSSKVRKMSNRSGRKAAAKTMPSPVAAQPVLIPLSPQERTEERLAVAK